MSDLIERLDKFLALPSGTRNGEVYFMDAKLIQEIAARIKELEDRLHLRGLDIITLGQKVGAIEAETIEKCIEIGKEIAKEWREDAVGRAFKNEWHNANISNAHGNGAEEVVETLRALAKPKTE